MSISSDALRKAGPFSGDGVATVFPFTFKVFTGADMLVVSTDQNNVSTTLALTTDYTVQLNGNQDSLPGGTVTLNAPLATGRTLVMGSQMAALQPLVLTNTGGFYPTSLNDEFDRLTILVQQLAERLGRTLQFSIADKSTSFATLPNASARANMIQGYDANGFPTLLPLPSSVGAGDIRADKFVAGTDFTAGTTTQLTLSRAPGTAANVEIFFDSVFQGWDQWALNGAVVTFTAPIPVGVSTVFVRSGSTLSTQLPAIGSVGDTQLSWGNVLGRVVDSVGGSGGLRSLSKAIYTRAFVTGYYAPGDGGGGNYYLDPADSTSVDNGGTVIVATDGGRWKLVWFGSVSVLQFGVKADNGATDNSTTLAKCATWVAGGAYRNKLRFPGGVYGYSVSPNWAINDADISFEGQVFLKYSGTGNAVIIDGGASTGGVFNLSFGRGVKPIVQGGAGSQNGVYCRSILQNCWIGARIDGAGTTYAGYRIEFAVCAVFDFAVSNNVQGGTFYSRPYYGGWVTNRGAGELTSYCTFINPILEGLASSGLYLDQAQGNTFIGGTMEGNASVGVYLTANAEKNKFYGTDYEVNTNHDVYCLGFFNEFHGINSQFKITFDGSAKDNNIFGGTSQDIVLTANTFGNLICGHTYNQNATTGQILDQSGGKNIRLRNRNFAQSNVENVPLSTTAVTVTASPFVFTNTSFNEEDVIVTGSNITLQLTHGGVATTGIVVGQFITLSPGDILTVTYTGATPNMNLLTR